MRAMQYKWPHLAEQWSEWWGCEDEPWFAVLCISFGILLMPAFCFVIVILVIINAKEDIYGYTGVIFLLSLFLVCTFFIVRGFKSLRESADPSIPMESAQYHLFVEDQYIKGCEECSAQSVNGNGNGNDSFIVEFYDAKLPEVLEENFLEIKKI